MPAKKAAKNINHQKQRLSHFFSLTTSQHISNLRHQLARLRNASLTEIPQAQYASKGNPNESETMDGWGFVDTKFEWSSDQSIRLTGNRYALCKHELKRIIPWFESIVGYKINRKGGIIPSYPPPVVPPSLSVAEYDEIVKILPGDRISLDPQCRLRHGHGQSHKEIYAVRYGTGLPRVPDAVIYPENDDEVQAIVALATAKQWVLIPFGGGTNVTQALLCRDTETRRVISVDMQRMNRLVWLDPVNHLACIEAGAVGRNIIEILRLKGFTMGHEPDSLEFSTLGGWIATHASGMKKNRYGNIEDIVLDVTVVTSQGGFTNKSVVPRESKGINLDRLMFGSEGTLGIITKAVVKIFPLPEVVRYGSYVFPNLAEGLEFAHDLVRSGHVPASVRLVDNLQFQFGQQLQSEPHFVKKIKSQCEKLYVTKIRGFKPDQMVACTIVHEGVKNQVDLEERQVGLIASRHHGIYGGHEHGERGYQLTFSIAYLRDFIMAHNVAADSFETSVPWSQVKRLCADVKSAIERKHKSLKLPGRPFFSFRVTQLYSSGVCVYFYLAVKSSKNMTAIEIFEILENEARETILKVGGSLSHHHGIGKHRQDYLNKVLTPAQLKIKLEIKNAFDPFDTFGAGNQLLSSTKRPE